MSLFSLVRRLGHPYKNRAPALRKASRHLFSASQVSELEQLFDKSKYLSSCERQKIAKELEMTENQIKTWYQNRRTKLKRQVNEFREQHRIILDMATSCKNNFA